jgi:hypothetical protein
MMWVVSNTQTHVCLETAYIIGCGCFQSHRPDTAMDRVNLREVAGHVDIAAAIKRHMRNAERERSHEKKVALLSVHTLKRRVHRAAETAGGIAMYMDVMTLASIEENRFDIDSTRINIEHMERMIAIQDMWDGVGKFDAAVPDIVIPDLPEERIRHRMAALQWCQIDFPLMRQGVGGQDASTVHTATCANTLIECTHTVLGPLWIYNIHGHDASIPYPPVFLNPMTFIDFHPCFHPSEFHPDLARLDRRNHDLPLEKDPITDNIVL